MPKDAQDKLWQYVKAKQTALEELDKEKAYKKQGKTAKAKAARKRAQAAADTMARIELSAKKRKR